MDSVNVTRLASPPRFDAWRRRAASTSTCRIARAATRLKWRGEVNDRPGDVASFIQASLTSPVGLMVAAGSERRTADARRRSSS